MAKKKKSIQPEQIDITNMEMQDTIRYNGHVSVSIMDMKTGRTKTITGHNAGEIGLFTFIVQALAGQTIANYRPSKIQACHHDTSNPDASDIDLLVSPIPYTTTPVVTKDGGSSNAGYNEVTYTFTIPGRAFQISPTTSSLNRFKLLNNSSDLNLTLCATFDLSGDKIISKDINWNTNLIVKWTLTLTNPNPS